MGRTLAGPLATVALAALVVSGCTSNRIGGVNTQPAPLTPAPSGTVSSGALPPPVQPSVTSPTVGQDGFPVAPGDTAAAADAEIGVDGTTETEATDGSVVEVAAATPVTREEMVGAWRVSTEGANCQMFMALTQWSTGFRAASRGCPGDTANVSSWNINGNRVVLSDSGGNQVATLFASGSGRFDGQTSSGRAISLAR